ncbi:hypothetical protein FM125_10740 [Micrococcus lylae]|uniref:Acyl-CoA carboxylase subunit epsilon n=1 Tax=Micrococcus lylae TaxID=1273 RepID=A0A1R4JUZ2_9MICC|nr:acyl-CoA carboxylase subunit epsilon [Micrococcus lylae]SJN35593.1 hypothetical protein FM125_10740 [Micrococcus lylae]
MSTEQNPERFDADTTAAEETQEAVQISGAHLEPEEMAALTAVIHQLQAGTPPVESERGGREQHRPSGPRGVDRTLDRRQRLGLWARPGSGQWRRGEGPQ